MRFHRCTLAAAWEQKKGKNLFDVLHLHRASSNELSVDLGVRRRETRAADKLRTVRQTLLFYRYTTLAKKIETGTQAKHRRVHA